MLDVDTKAVLYFFTVSDFENCLWVRAGVGQEVISSVVETGNDGSVPESKNSDFAWLFQQLVLMLDFDLIAVVLADRKINRQAIWLFGSCHPTKANDPILFVPFAGESPAEATGIGGVVK